MKKKSKIQGVFLDFDGVISKNSVDHTIKLLSNFINKVSPNQNFPISKNYIKKYFKCVSAFPTEKSIHFLFSSLGLEDKINLLYNEIKRTDLDLKSDKIVIEKDFEEFIRFCKKNRIRYYIISLTSSERLKKIEKIVGRKAFYKLNKGSKADTILFTSLIKELGINPHEWFYLDDSPLALRAGKVAELNTVLMKNNVFTESDFKEFKNSIDYKVSSFKEFQSLLSRISR